MNSADPLISPGFFFLDERPASSVSGSVRACVSVCVDAEMQRDKLPVNLFYALLPRRTARKVIWTAVSISPPVSR